MASTVKKPFMLKDYCLDVLDHSGLGRRRRRREIDSDETSKKVDFSSKSNATLQNSPSTKFDGNFQYSVLMPADIYHQELRNENSCQAFVVTCGILGCLLLLSALILCFQAIRLQTLLAGKYRQNNMDTMARERSRKLSLGHFGIPGYTGRTTLQ